MKIKNIILSNYPLILTLIGIIIFLYGCNTIAGTARGFGQDIKQTFGYFGKNSDKND